MNEHEFFLASGQRKIHYYFEDKCVFNLCANIVAKTVCRYLSVSWSLSNVQEGREELEVRPEGKEAWLVCVTPEPDVLGKTFWEEDGRSLTIQQRLWVHGKSDAGLYWWAARGAPIF